MITSEDYKQLEGLNIPKTEVENQYKLLTQGVKFIALNRAATINDGIKALSENEAISYANFYDSKSKTVSIQKFVPASGAATRMFKELAELAENGIETQQIKTLFASLQNLAFYELIPDNLDYQETAKYILHNLGYESTPKGLIPFHKYKGFTRTPFKEHWIEGLKYASSKGKVEIHFTVSEEHQKAFEKIYNTRRRSFFEEYKLDLQVEFSHQLKSTDTIIVDEEGNILHDNNNKPILRPGGHGALIQNLNNLEADLVFVKNIDNISHEKYLETTVLYKKALAGILLQMTSKIFKQLLSIDANTSQMEEIELLGSELMIEKPTNYSDWDEGKKIDYWKNKFNRPIRVCGMVKNEGAPGGGPFWARQNNEVTLQIVESAQIDMAETEQYNIVQSATYFNPVDLVCYLTDYQGNKFNLIKFIDKSAAFITNKTVQGKEVKVLERPGLWNGAMADWTTVFVEVPIGTFNPVKNINDLLKPAHLL